MNPPDGNLVLVTVEAGVVSIVLNRPERQNAWTGALGQQYFAALADAARNSDVRAIVVSGAGGSFCVGADPTVLSGLADGAPAPGGEISSYWFPLTIGKPIIAAIAGPCFGIGMQQALCCDIRLAADDAKFATAYARRGLIAEMGMSWLLPRIVGLGHATDLLLSARLMRAPEAERINLVNRTVPAADLMAEAMDYARSLAEKCAPRSMRAIKEQLYRDLTDELPPAYDRSAALLTEAFGWPDFKEGVQSWREQRPPAFPGLPPELALLDLEGAKPTEISE